MSVCLCISVSVCLSIGLSVCLSVCLSACLSVSVWLYTSVSSYLHIYIHRVPSIVALPVLPEVSERAVRGLPGSRNNLVVLGPWAKWALSKPLI